MLLLRAVAVGGPPPVLEMVPVSGLESLTLWTTWRQLLGSLSFLLFIIIITRIMVPNFH